MNNGALLETTLSLLIGAVIVINGVTSTVDTVLAEARSAVHGANLHQLATVLELYYLEHGEYPAAPAAVPLVELLQEQEYILNDPLDPSVFEYMREDNGQDYTLKRTEEE